MAQNHAKRYGPRSFLGSGTEFATPARGAQWLARCEAAAAWAQRHWGHARPALSLLHMAGKPIRCRVGLHAFVVEHPDDERPQGPDAKVCRLCGRRTGPGVFGLPPVVGS